MTRPNDQIPDADLPDYYRREAARLRSEADTAETVEIRRRATGRTARDGVRAMPTVTDAWDSPEAEAARIAQVRTLREQAGKGGLRFEAYLPPDLAEWLLDLIERGVFAEPSEAVFVMPALQNAVALASSANFCGSAA